MRFAYVFALIAIVGFYGCDKARKAGSDAVDTAAGAAAEGTEKTIQRMAEKYDERAAEWLKKTDVKIVRVYPGRDDGHDRLVDVHLVVRNDNDEKIDLVSFFMRDLILLNDADGVSHRIERPRSGEILVHPGTTARQEVTFRMVGGARPAALLVVGSDPVPIDESCFAPAEDVPPTPGAE